MVPDDYASFLVRFWRDPSSDGQCSRWHGEIEHVQSGSRWRFRTMSELLAFLAQAAVATTATVPSGSKGEQG